MSWRGPLRCEKTRFCAARYLPLTTDQRDEAITAGQKQCVAAIAQSLANLLTDLIAHIAAICGRMKPPDNAVAGHMVNIRQHDIGTVLADLSAI